MLPHQRHSATSAEAAERARPIARNARERVRQAYAAAGREGLTDEQMIECTQMAANTARPRRIELLTAGELVLRGQRQTRSGRWAAVYVLRECLEGEQLRLL